MIESKRDRRWMDRPSRLLIVMFLIIAPVHVCGQRQNMTAGPTDVDTLDPFARLPAGTMDIEPYTARFSDELDRDANAPRNSGRASGPRRSGRTENRRALPERQAMVGMPKMQDSELLRNLDQQIAESASEEARRLHLLKEQLQELGNTLRQQRDEISRERLRAQKADEKASQSEELAEEVKRRDVHARRLAEQARMRAEEARIEAEKQRIQAAVAPPAHEESTPTNPTEESTASASKEPQPPSLSDILQTSPLPISDAPVDRLALADNLFGAGEDLLAREIYKQLLSQRTTKTDVAWLHIQIANCHRRLNQLPEAEKHYRIVAGMQNDDFFSQSARWWLASLNKRAEMKQTLTDWQQTLAAAKAEINQ